MKYIVKDQIGENGITLQDGQKVFEVIFPELSQNHEVELDFTDVKIIASPFLNAAIGQLLRDLSSDELNRLLKITNLSVLARPVLKRVIENAKQYYANDAIRQAIETVVEIEADRTNAD